MTISTEQILMVIGGASAITTAIFWGSFYIGKITGRLDRVEQTLEDHDEKIDQLARALMQERR